MAITNNFMTVIIYIVYIILYSFPELTVIVGDLRRKAGIVSSEHQHFTVRRSHIVADAIREGRKPNFSPNRLVTVSCMYIS